jgi:phospholipid-binding lipoprotein MlaA
MLLLNKLKSFCSVTALVCVLSLTLAGCATKHAGGAGAQGVNDHHDAAVSDPLEPLNRATFALNGALDKVLFNPITKAYRFIVPEFGRTAIHNVLDNLKSPVYLANELLQGNVKDAGVVVRRFATNTIVGVGGLIDVAEKHGITYQPEDFGQTLAVWGVGAGPYIVWPILGPSTVRDSAGFVADMGMDPINWYAMNTDRDAIRYTRTGLTVLDVKDRTMDSVEDLRKNSGDPYTALKSVYTQRRNALQDDLEPGKASLPDIE